jgi:hypothetical protein
MKVTSDRSRHARRRGPAGLAISARALAVGLAACDGGPAEGQLAWCARNQTEVARTALDLGLMEPGEVYTAWKTSEGAYRRACASAFDTPGRAP